MYSRRLLQMQQQQYRQIQQIAQITHRNFQKFRSCHLRSLNSFQPFRTISSRMYRCRSSSRSSSRSSGSHYFKIGRQRRFFCNSNMVKNGNELWSESSFQQSYALRFGIIYGACGTLAAYLNIHYADPVLTIEGGPPTPEKFLFSVFCFVVAGFSSWLLFFARPNAILNAVNASVRYGLLNGVQTSVLAIGVSVAMISMWSLYFDCIEYRDSSRKYNNTQLRPDLLVSSATNYGASPRSHSTVIEIEDEDGRASELIEDDIEIVGHTNNAKKQKNSVLIQTKLTGNDHPSNAVDNNNNIDGKGNESQPKPSLNWSQIIANMKEPSKLFLLTSGPIWLFCGSITGMIAVRMLVTSALMSAETSAMAVTALVAANHNHNHNHNDKGDAENEQESYNINDSFLSAENAIPVQKMQTAWPY